METGGYPELQSQGYPPVSGSLLPSVPDYTAVKKDSITETIHRRQKIL